MRATSITPTRAALLVLAGLSLVPLLRLAGAGLWEPWELNRAEAARQMAAGETPYWSVPEVEAEGERPPLASWVTAAGFALGDSAVGAGKAAVTVFLLLSALAAFLLLRPVLATNTLLLGFAVFFAFPVVFFQGTSAGGDGVAFGAYAVAFAALFRLLDAPLPGSPARALAGRLAAAAGGLTLTYFALGGALGLLLPVGSAALASLLGGGLRPALLRAEAPAARLQARVRLGVLLAAAALLVWFLSEVLLHKPAEGSERFTLAVGGAKAMLPLETFDQLLVRLGYLLFPWCAFAPVALAWVFRPDREDEAVPSDDPDGPALGPDRALGRHAALHVVLAFPLLAYWNWRFHPAPVVLVFPLAILVADYLGGALEGGRRHLRYAAAFAGLVALVVVRDALKFPRDFLEVIGFPKPGDVVTEDPRFSRGLLLGLLLLLLAVAMTHLGAAAERNADGTPARRGWERSLFGWHADLLAGLGDAWRSLLGRGGGGRSPLGAAAYLTPMVLGGLAWLALGTAVLVSEATTAGRFMFTHLGLTAALILLALPFAVLLLDLLRRVAWEVARRSDPGLRGGLVVAGGLAVSMVMGLRVAPHLDKRFSLEPAADAAAAHGSLDGRLKLLQVELAAPNYYPVLAVGEPVGDVDQAAAWLAGGSAADPRFLVLPSRNQVLNEVNLKYRDRRGGALLPVISDPDARYLLAISDLPPGAVNRSPIARYVSLTPPTPMYAVLEGNFDDKVRYIGYDITSHEDGTVGALDNVVVTHYWQVIGRLQGDYKIFLHVDGMGDRINGDHDPAGGLFPTRYWRPGDYVADPQEVRIPFFARPALNPTAYRMYVGLFKGETRLPLKDGEGNDNRLWGGVLRVR